MTKHLGTTATAREALAPPVAPEGLSRHVRKLLASGLLDSSHERQSLGQVAVVIPMRQTSHFGQFDLPRNEYFMGTACRVQSESVFSLAPKSTRPSLSRAREWEWRQANHELLQRQYLGEWIALERENIIAHGTNPEDVVERARAMGVSVPYVFCVMKREPNASWAGF